ncbi:MAG: hypothetical protein ABI480_05060 [Chitinophagaceae bacterium]
MTRISALLVLCLLVLASFTPAAFCHRSGISGHVYFVSGNQMPSPDRPAAAPQGLKTTLYVYELTNMSQVGRDGVSAFYKSISTKLVKTVETNDDGSFKVKLKPGKYSLFVKKGDLFFSNIFDGENNIYPVEVEKGKMTEEEFKVNYGAAY